MCVSKSFLPFLVTSFSILFLRCRTENNSFFNFYQTKMKKPLTTCLPRKNKFVNVINGPTTNFFPFSPSTNFNFLTVYGIKLHPVEELQLVRPVTWTICSHSLAIITPWLVLTLNGSTTQIPAAMLIRHFIQRLREGNSDIKQTVAL